jgi:hypothetical protein
VSGDRSIVHPPHLQAGKAATKALIRAFGGQEAAEEVTGRAQSRLSAYGLPNTADFAPIDVVVALEARTHGTPGHPLVTRWLATENGYLLVPKPAALPSDVDWHMALGEAVKEMGDATQKICAALPNGVTAEEIRKGRIREEIAEAQQRLAQLDALAVRALEEA